MKVIPADFFEKVTCRILFRQLVDWLMFPGLRTASDIISDDRKRLGRETPMTPHEVTRIFAEHIRC